MALMDWLEVSGADVSPFERIVDLTFFAVQSRYDDGLKFISPDWPFLMGITASLLKEVQSHLSRSCPAYRFSQQLLRSIAAKSLFGCWDWRRKWSLTGERFDPCEPIPAPQRMS